MRSGLTLPCQKTNPDGLFEGGIVGGTELRGVKSEFEGVICSGRCGWICFWKWDGLFWGHAFRMLWAQWTSSFWKNEVDRCAGWPDKYGFFLSSIMWRDKWEIIDGRALKTHFFVCKFFYRFFYFTHARATFAPLLANCQFFTLNCWSYVAHGWWKCKVDRAKI